MCKVKMENDFAYLFRGLNSIKKKDSSPLRKQLFAEFLKNRPLLFFFCKFHDWRFLKWIHANIFAIYAFLPILKANINIPESGSGAVAVYEYSNEARCITWRLKEELKGEVSFSSYTNIRDAFSKLKFFKIVFKLFRINKKFIYRNGLLVGIRQSQFICAYTYFNDKFSELDLSKLKMVTSTEANPCIIAVALSAKQRGARLIYINHGFLDEELGVFFHDEFLVQGEALVDRIKPFIQTFAERSVIHIVNSYYPVLPLKEVNPNIKKIGIVLSLAPSEEKVFGLISLLEKTFRDVKIDLRCHPNQVISGVLIKKIASLCRVEVVPASDWATIDLDWDFAFAGNTSAQIDVIAKGVPVVGFDLDNNPDDMCGFYRNNFTFRVDTLDSLVSMINSFYQSDDWKVIRSKYLPAFGQGT